MTLKTFHFVQGLARTPLLCFFAISKLYLLIHFKKTDFHSYHIFESFLMVLKGFRGARRLLNTIRTHLDTAGAGLTFPNIDIPQYSCFWECQCIRNDPQNLPFCLGPPQNTFIIISSIYQRDIV